MHQKSLLPSAWKIPEIFRQRLGESAGRQRAMFHDGHLLLVLHAPPGPEDEERQGRFFWRKPDASWASTTEAPGQTSLDVHLQDYAKILDELDDQEAKAHSAEAYFDLMRRLNPIVRASRNLHEALQEARECVPEDKRIIDYRDRAYALERQTELLAGDAKSTLDYTIARQSEAQARTSARMASAAHRLNLLAAFFFPIATLSAIFGVNLRHGMEPDRINDYWPFAAVLIAGLLAGLLLTLFVARRSDL